jgi:hypothetical protein
MNLPSQGGEFAKLATPTNEINEIKKALYRENPVAKLNFIQNEVAHYQTYIESLNMRLWFDVPVAQMTGGRFYAEENSKHLIRWINL